MISGEFRDCFPRIRLVLQGTARSIEVELIVDTGFDGDFVLPGNLIRQLGLTPLYHSRRKLADGTVNEYPAYEVEVELNGSFRTAEVLQFDHNPLIGTEILNGWRFSVDLNEGGELTLEPP
jgi:clan AA aspartic protease